MSEIRENKITGEWVIIAPERARRGGSLAPASDRSEIGSFLSSCPFCLGNETATSEERFRVDGEDGRWLLRSVVNKFSVLSPSGEVSPSCPGFGEASVNAVGLHEVIIESPRHDVSLAVLPVAHVDRILEAYRHRFCEFYRDARVRHVIVFKNHGADAGASQQHPHSQIVGLPIVPGQVVERVARARRFFEESGRCLACAQIAQERKQACRIIFENLHFVAFIPYAALSPYHLWIFPKTHSACFSEQPPETLPALAEIVGTVLGKLYGLLGNPAFNLVVRSLEPGKNDVPHFHWYISIVPRINQPAGLELGTGLYVNPSLPESCAKALREFAVR